MSSTDSGTPMQWDPQARNGAGGWVERLGNSPPPPPVTSGPDPAAGPQPSPLPRPEPAPAPGPGPGGPGPGPGPAMGPLPVPTPVPLPAPEQEPGPGPDRARGKAALIAVAVLLAVAAVGLGVDRELTGDDDAPPAATSQSPSVPTGLPNTEGGKSGPDTSTTGTSGTGASGTGASGTTAADTQATAVDSLLNSSAADRQKVVAAVRAVAACDAVPEARAALNEAADNRENLTSRLDALDVGLIDGGTEAVAELRTAWQHSAKADRAFADWASSAEGCTTSADVTLNSDYHSGVSHSVQATRAKQAFIQLWNPIAGEYGLSSRTETDI